MTSVGHELYPQVAPDLADAYRAAGYWAERTIGEELAVSAHRWPDRDAVAAAQGRLSYAELDAQTDRIAAGLHVLGLAVGDRVLFQVTNRLESVVAWYACLKAGLVPVATLASHRGHEIAQISRRSRARAHLVEEALPGFDLVGFAFEQRSGHPTLEHVLTVGGREPVAGATPLETLGDDLSSRRVSEILASTRARVGADDLAVLQLSGGTTGVPKLIPRRHAEYWYNARAYAERLEWTEHTRVAHLIPVIHNAGITCAVQAAHSVGACLVLGTPDALASAPLLGTEKATAALIGHAHFQALRDPAFLAQASSLTQLVLSGTKVPEALFEMLEQRGIWSGQLYGMAEGLCCASRVEDPSEARLLSVGTPISELDEVRILEPGTEAEVVEGTVGEVAVRGPYTIPGYYDGAEHQASSFTTDGFYRTGDLARWETFDGVRHLLIEGRIKDVINRGGEKINAEEVEMILLRHPDVVEAAVVAMPDPRLGERSCAYLVTTAPVDLPVVQAHFAALGVAKFKWPERIETVEELPRTRIGKLDKKQLREMVADAVQSSG